ncbi:nucleoside deaminase, partial [Micrococcus endophyticus]
MGHERVVDEVDAHGLHATARGPSARRDAPAARLRWAVS